MSNRLNCIFKAASPSGIRRLLHRRDCEYLSMRLIGGFKSIDLPRYSLSLAYLGSLSLTGIIKYVHVADLRRTNIWAASLLPFHLRSILNKNVPKYDGFKAHEPSLSMLWSFAELNHAVLNICLFPPLFFFYGLYYTDVWSALSVLIAFQFHQRRWRKAMVVAAIASLAFRQTNIFWVSIFLGGMEVIRRIERGRLGIEFPAQPTVVDVVTGSWQHSRVYDPLISQASFEGWSPFRDRMIV